MILTVATNRSASIAAKSGSVARVTPGSMRLTASTRSRFTVSTPAASACRLARPVKASSAPTCVLFVAATLSGCWGRKADEIVADETESVIQPEVERRKIKPPKIDNDNFEVSAYYGLMSVEDAIMYLTSLPREQLASTEGKALAKEELGARIRAAYGDEKVVRILFTAFVTQ